MYFYFTFAYLASTARTSMHSIDTYYSAENVQYELYAYEFLLRFPCHTIFYYA